MLCGVLDEGKTLITEDILGKQQYFKKKYIILIQKFNQLLNNLVNRHHIKKQYLLLIMFTLASSVCISQRTELGLFLGGSYYLGDLNPKKHFLLTGPAIGGLYRYNLNPRFTLKNNIYVGLIRGDDKISKSNENRNLNFTSPIGELSIQMEFNFFPYVTGHKKYKFSPYIFIGGALSFFQPQTEYKGQWYKLQSLSTEGQGTTYNTDKQKYSLINFSMPFGLGFKFSIRDNVCFSPEWGIRKSSTDYIDDVSTTYPDLGILEREVSEVAAALSDRSENTLTSNKEGMQRGNARTKDWYSFFGVTITYKINKRRMCATYKKSKPIFYY